MQSEGIGGREGIDAGVSSEIIFNSDRAGTLSYPIAILHTINIIKE